MAVSYIIEIERERCSYPTRNAKGIQHHSDSFWDRHFMRRTRRRDAPFRRRPDSQLVGATRCRRSSSLRYGPCSYSTYFLAAMYSAVQINVVKSCVCAFLYHATFDHVLFWNSRVFLRACMRQVQVVEYRSIRWDTKNLDWGHSHLRIIA